MKHIKRNADKSNDNLTPRNFVVVDAIRNPKRNAGRHGNPHKPTPNLKYETAWYDEVEWVIPKPDNIDEALWDELTPKQKLLAKSNARYATIYGDSHDSND